MNGQPQSNLTPRERETIMYLAILRPPVPFGELSRQMSWHSASDIGGTINALLAKRIIRGAGRGYELIESPLTWIRRLGQDRQSPGDDITVQFSRTAEN